MARHGRAPRGVAARRAARARREEGVVGAQRARAGREEVQLVAAVEGEAGALARAAYQLPKNSSNKRWQQPRPYTAKNQYVFIQKS